MAKLTTQKNPVADRAEEAIEDAVKSQEEEKRIWATVPISVDRKIRMAALRDDTTSGVFIARLLKEWAKDKPEV